MDLVIGKKNSLEQIKGCSTAICQCGYTIGVPKKYLKEHGQWFNIECPVCGHGFQFFASFNSCYM